MFLRWLVGNLDRLVEAKAVAIDDYCVHTTRQVIEEFEKSFDTKTGSFLESLLNYSTLEKHVST